MSLIILSFCRLELCWNIYRQVWRTSFPENYSGTGIVPEIHLPFTKQFSSIPVQCRIRASRGCQSAWPFTSQPVPSTIFLCPEQTSPTLTQTCKAHHRTVRMNWWVSTRKQSAAPKASGEEPRQPQIRNSQEVSAGRAGKSTAHWLLIMRGTAVKPRPMMVGFVSVSVKPVFLSVDIHLLTVQ